MLIAAEGTGNIELRFLERALPLLHPEPQMSSPNHP